MRYISTIIAAFLLTTCSLNKVYGAGISVEALFRRTTTLKGQAYGFTRNALVLQGKALLPFLTEKLKSGNWRERDLARILALRIEHPATAVQYDRLFKESRYTIELRNNGTGLVKFGPEEAENVNRSKMPVATRGDFVLEKDFAVLILDGLREKAGISGSTYDIITTRAFRLLKHLAASETSPGLLDLYGYSYRNKLPIVDALVRIGKPSLPYLRNALKNAPLSSVSDQRSSTSARSQARLLSIGAAVALGRLGDSDSAAILVEKCKRATFGDQIQAFSRALGMLKAPEGVPVVFRKLMLAASISRQEKVKYSNSKLIYGHLRESMRAFGDVAKSFLRESLKSEDSIGGRILIKGLLYDIEHRKEAKAFYRGIGEFILAKQRKKRILIGLGMRTRVGNDPISDIDVNNPVAIGNRIFWHSGNWHQELSGLPTPVPFLVEKCWVHPTPENAEKLLKLKHDSVVADIMAENLLLHRYSQSFRQHAGLLAKAAGSDAIKTYRKLLGERSARNLPCLIENVLLLKDKRGIPFLEEIIDRGGRKRPSRTYERAAHLARAVLPFLQGKKECLAKLLRDKSESLRFTVAHILARKMDVRALDVLLTAASQTTKENHSKHRNAILGFGKDGLARIREYQRNNKDWQNRLLCEALILRISNRSLAKKFDSAGRYRTHGFGCRGGPRVVDYVAVGNHIANAVGPEGLPLCEAALVFGADHASPNMVIFAIAQFKKERSIAMILKTIVSRKGSWCRFAGMALKEFGEKGTEAAKKVAPPDRSKAHYRGRSSRHHAAAEALTIAKDIKSVDKIIEGLTEPRPMESYVWRYRMESYLSLAAKCHDRRLIDPTIKLFKQEKELQLASLPVLREYDDKRIIPLITPLLKNLEPFSYRAPIVMALAKQLGLSVADHLIGVMHRQGDENVRAGAARALVKVVWDPEICFDEKNRAEKKINQLRKQLTTQAIQALTKMLKDSSTAMQVVAAESLADIGRGGYGNEPNCDARPVGPLLTWIKNCPDPSLGIIEYLERSGDPDSGIALLSAYRASGGKSRRLANALGRLKYSEAVPEIMRALNNRVARDEIKFGIPEMGALASCGPEGIEEVHKLLCRSPELPIRLLAAQALGKQKYQKAFAGIEALFQEILYGGVWDPVFTAGDSTRPQKLFVHYVNSLGKALAAVDGKRAYAVLIRSLIHIQDENILRSMSWTLKQLEEAHPELAKQTILFSSKEARLSAKTQVKLPHLRFLELCDYWQEATSEDKDTQQAAYKKLLAAGDEALEAMLELCFFSFLSSPQAVKQAVKDLANQAKRKQAISLLALGRYSQRMLEELLAGEGGDVLAYGTVIFKWRRRGPWFIREHPKLLDAATTLLEVHWPIDDLCRFAIGHLEQLGRVKKVKHHWGYRPLGPLLASIRYSSDRKERELLTDFVRRAESGAAQVAISVMKNGLSGRTRWDIAKHWRTMPEHKYSFEPLWERLDPNDFDLFEKAMYSLPQTPRLRRKLREIAGNKNTSKKLVERIYGFLWHFMHDPEAYSYYVNRLEAEDYRIFETAVHRLTDCKFAYSGTSIIPHLKKVLDGSDPKRRLLVLRNMDVYLGKESIRLAANTIARFLISREPEEQKAAAATLTRLQSARWLDIFSLLAGEHENRNVRLEMKKLQEEWEQKKKEKE